MIDQNEAKHLFWELMFHCVYKNTLKKWLKESFSDIKRNNLDNPFEELKGMLSTMSPEEHEVIVCMIEEIIDRTIFNFLVLMDNKMGYPLEGIPSELALYFQTVSSQKTFFDYQPEEMVRINMSYTGDGDLHDDFCYLLREDKNVNANINNQSEAKNVFLKLLLDTVYNSTLKTVHQKLALDLQNDYKKKSREEVVVIIKKINPEQREIIASVIDQIKAQTLLNLLALIDNKRGYPLEGIPSELALYLQTASNPQALFDYQPEEAVRINMSYTENGDLHDDFCYLLNENH